MRNAIFLLGVFLLIANSLLAQVSFPNAQNASILPVLDSVAVGNLHFKHTKGYRILIYSGSNRIEAVKVKENLYKQNPDAEITFQYLSPTFKVKLGNYITKIEAVQHLKDIKEFFPEAILLPDMVNLR